MTDPRIEEAITLMNNFAQRTGLNSKQPPRRYLWTDAFAVCNYLELYRQTGEQSFQKTALELVDQVHQILGRHRKDSVHSGWISGLDEEQARQHPTAGGLRIGKRLNERLPGEAVNESLEWEQDGQYFHYLTKWMHALNRTTEVTGDFRYNRWALELAKTAQAKFTYTLPDTQEKRMYWKMSIDLSHPLVSSMGQHDALDAFITYQELAVIAAGDPERSEDTDLSTEIADALSMCHNIHWMTDDPLGIGGLLSDAYRLTQLIIHSGLEGEDMLLKLLSTAKEGLDAFLNTNSLNYPVEYRLAFRELGLAIGLKAIKKMLHLFPDEPLVKNLEHYQSLADEIIHFWLSKENQQNSTWQEHIDINSVMLATALAPEGYHELYKGVDHGK